jgi:hypothetical protein
MKKMILLMALVGGTAHAGLLDAAATSGWPVKETKRYKLDVYGFDARAYEFKTDNGMTCIAVFPGGDAKGWQMQCVPTK